MRKRSEREIQREKHWQEVVRGQRESGQSVRAYCRQAGIEESAFYWWRRELSRRSGERKDPGQRGNGRRRSRSTRPATLRSVVAGRSPVAEEVGFLPVKVAAERGAESGQAIEIVLGGDRVLRVRPGFDWRTLLDVLGALEGRRC